MTTDQPTTLGSDTVAALESAWADIKDRHPDVIGDVVFRVGSGKAGRRGSLVLGSVTVAPVWEESRSIKSRAKSDPTGYHSVFIAGETLAQHPIKLLETLIHEAAHTVAMTRQIKDTSRQYRYHNKRFRSICEEMGLEWTHLTYAITKGEDGENILTENPEFDPNEPADLKKNPRYLTCEAKADTIIGFSDMKITRQTAKQYADTVKNLDARVQVQLGSVQLTGSAPKKRRTVLVAPVTVSKIPSGEILSSEEFDSALSQVGVTRDDEMIQRIGITVYEGLVRRNLLTSSHIATIEEV
jgi:hypothetical protein